MLRAFLSGKASIVTEKLLIVCTTSTFHPIYIGIRPSVGLGDSYELLQTKTVQKLCANKTLQSATFRLVSQMYQLNFNVSLLQVAF